MPPYCRFLLWLSIQDDAFFDESNGMSAKTNGADGVEKKKTPAAVKKDTLWPTLTNDLSLTYEQDEKLKALYKYELAVSIFSCGCWCLYRRIVYAGLANRRRPSRSGAALHSLWYVSTSMSCSRSVIVTLLTLSAWIVRHRII